MYIGLILSAFLDLEGPDRLHALESLAKLGYRIGDASSDSSVTIMESAAGKKGAPKVDAFREAAASTDPEMRAYAAWVFLNSPTSTGRDREAEIKLRSIISGQETGKLAAAFAIGSAAKIDTETWDALARAWKDDNSDSLTRIGYCFPLLAHADSFSTADMLEDRACDIPF